MPVILSFISAYQPPPPSASTHATTRLGNPGQCMLGWKAKEKRIYDN